MTATKSQPQGGMSFLSRETVFLSLGGLTDEVAGGTLDVSLPTSALAYFASESIFSDLKPTGRTTIYSTVSYTVRQAAES